MLILWLLNHVIPSRHKKLHFHQYKLTAKLKTPYKTIERYRCKTCGKKRDYTWIVIFHDYVNTKEQIEELDKIEGYIDCP